MLFVNNDLVIALIIQVTQQVQSVFCRIQDDAIRNDFSHFYVVNMVCYNFHVGSNIEDGAFSLCCLCPQQTKVCCIVFLLLFRLCSCLSLMFSRNVYFSIVEIYSSRGMRSTN